MFWRDGKGFGLNNNNISRCGGACPVLGTKPAILPRTLPEVELICVSYLGFFNLMNYYKTQIYHLHKSIQLKVP